MQYTLPVTNIQRFSIHDGPGIRTTVFLKGCPLRCIWCHNPETKNIRNEIFYTDSSCIRCGGCVALCPAHNHTIRDGQHLFDRSACTLCGACVQACPTEALELCSKDMTVEEILQEVLKDLPFYGDNGGVTLSGGEPMLHAAESIALLRSAKEQKLHTAIETCGQFSPDFIPDLIDNVDLFLYDVKDTDSTRHKRNTGADNSRILSNLYEIDRQGGRTIMRCVAVKTINFTQDNIEGLAEVYHNLHNCLGVEFMPYHPMGGSKSRRLGHEDDGHQEWIPSEQDLDEAKAYLRSCKVQVIG